MPTWIEELLLENEMNERAFDNSHHNGDTALAVELMQAAKEAGANCVKFQMRNMSSVYRRKSLEKDNKLDQIEDDTNNLTLGLERFDVDKFTKN